MATVNLTSSGGVSGRVGLSAAAFTPTVIRALTPAQVYVYPPGVYVSLISLGITATVTMTVNRAITFTTVTLGYPTYAQVYSGSIGITGPGSIGVNRALYTLGSTGIDSILFLPTVDRALTNSDSVGISDAGTLTASRALQSSASLGLTATVGFSRILTLQSSASLGLTATVTPRFVRGLSSSGSVGLTARQAMGVSRALRSLASLGISGRVVIYVMPSALGSNVIILFEATDAQNPATYAAILPREYQRIMLDQTVSSYPQPYALLN